MNSGRAAWRIRNPHGLRAPADSSVVRMGVELRLLLAARQLCCFYSTVTEGTAALVTLLATETRCLEQGCNTLTSILNHNC